MAGNRKKTGGRDFKPGQSGNPKGATKLPPEVREFRKASKEIIIQEFKDLWALPFNKLDMIANDESQPAVKKAIAKAISNAAKSGDMQDLEPILKRVIGPVPAEIKGDVNHTVNLHKQLVEFIQGIEQKELLNAQQMQDSEEEDGH